MAHLLQVGAGSGGITVLDLVCRDPRIKHVTLIEPDIYKPHNVFRHLFPPSDVGQSKAALARRWLREIRPELEVDTLECDLLDPLTAGAIEEAASTATVGVCAVDNEPAKYHWDALMRRHRLPWTLGEVLSGGIGGFVHCFLPEGPCYGCVASHLQRSVAVDKPEMPDYSLPGGPIAETTLPASKASIGVIASLHAQLTLGLLDHGANFTGFTSLLMTLERVPGVFEDMFRCHRFQIPRLTGCLVCGHTPAVGELDQSLDEALSRLA